MDEEGSNRGLFLFIVTIVAGAFAHYMSWRARRSWLLLLHDLERSHKALNSNSKNKHEGTQKYKCHIYCSSAAPLLCCNFPIDGKVLFRSAFHSVLEALLIFVL